MSAGFARAVLWLLIVLTILALGWKKPLRYVLMTQEQIAQMERDEEAVKFPPTPLPTPWKPLGTTLDQQETNRRHH